MNGVDGCRLSELSRVAFDLWATIRGAYDLAVLRSASKDPLLQEIVLRERLKRGDTTAIDQLIDKLDGDEGMSWWSYARHVWSSAMYEALDRALQRASERPPPDADAQYEMGANYARVIMRLPMIDAERIILRYWPSFGSTMHFLQAALYVATPELRARADVAIKASSSPETLFRHITIHYGIRNSDEVGITREEQIEALAPYLDHLRQHDLNELAAVCNENGWYDLRRRLIDPHLEDEQVMVTDRLYRKLDATLARSHSGFIDHDIDDLLKAGVSWGELALTLENWLTQQTSLRALELAERALRHAGKRGDAAILRAWAGDDACAVSTHLRRRDGNSSASARVLGAGQGFNGGRKFGSAGSPSSSDGLRRNAD